jgi:hypothetical protein
MFQLVGIVCLAAIFCFFSQEFAQLLKKIFAIRGAKTFLPLALASFIAFAIQPTVKNVLNSFQGMVSDVVAAFAYLSSFTDFSEPISQACALLFITLVPVLILNEISRRKSNHKYPYPQITSVFLFVASFIFIFCPSMC